MPSWVEAANSEGPPQSERIPCDGQEHAVRISKVVHHAKGQLMQSQNGDPQMMLVFQDEQAREALQKVTLKESAMFVLAKIMAAFDPPADLARMEADGIKIEHFADPEWAEQVLIDRQLTIRIDPDPNNSKYTIITPVKKRGDGSVPTAPPAAPAPAPPASTTPPPTPPAPQSSAAPPAAPPPPAPPPPTQQRPSMTKDAAWALVVQEWVDPEKLTTAWYDAIKGTGKDESQLTGEEWAEIADRLKVPF